MRFQTRINLAHVAGLQRVYRIPCISSAIIARRSVVCLRSFTTQSHRDESTASTHSSAIPIQRNVTLSDPIHTKSVVSRMPSTILAAAAPYINLARITKPVGTLLLFYPCSFGILMASYSSLIPITTTLSTTFLFLTGAFIMRGAGCTLNDLIDRNYDGKVERTKTRPLPSGQTTPTKAILFLGAQLLTGLAILVQLNPFCIQMGCASLVLVVLYPMMKRWTTWPQLFLGITFNVGAVIGWASITGALSLAAVPLYFSGILWTLHYDTLYALQDAKCDVKAGIKSSALATLGYTKPFLATMSVSSVGMLAVAGFMNGQGAMFYCGGAGALLHLAWQIWKLDLGRKSDLAKELDASGGTNGGLLFKSNVWVGFIVMLGLICDLVVKGWSEGGENVE